MGLDEIVSIVRQQAAEADVQDDYLVESLLLSGLQRCLLLSCCPLLCGLQRCLLLSCCLLLSGARSDGCPARRPCRSAAAGLPRDCPRLWYVAGARAEQARPAAALKNFAKQSGARGHVDFTAERCGSGIAVY